MSTKGCISSVVSIPNCPHCGKQSWDNRILDASEREAYLWRIYCPNCGAQGTLISPLKKVNAFRYVFVMNEICGKGVRWEREAELKSLLLTKKQPDWRTYVSKHPGLLLFTSIAALTETNPTWEDVAPGFDPVDQTPPLTEQSVSETAFAV